MADSYRRSVVEAESGYLSDEIEAAKADLLDRIDHVLDETKASLKREVSESFAQLEAKANRLGGSLSSSDASR